MKKKLSLIILFFTSNTFVIHINAITTQAYQETLRDVQLVNEQLKSLEIE